MSVIKLLSCYADVSNETISKWPAVSFLDKVTIKEFLSTLLNRYLTFGLVERDTLRQSPANKYNHNIIRSWPDKIK